jgi:hypothetical protein
MWGTAVWTLECFDRIYLNGWVPNLQVPGQVVNFLSPMLQPVCGGGKADRPRGLSRQ